jgi:hypothetical protein
VGTAAGARSEVGEGLPDWRRRLGGDLLGPSDDKRALRDGVRRLLRPAKAAGDGYFPSSAWQAACKSSRAATVSMSLA